MLHVERGRDDLQSTLASRLAKLVELAERRIDNGRQGLFRRDDAAAERGIGLAELSHLVQRDDLFAATFDTDECQCSRVETVASNALDKPVLDGLNNRIAID